MTSWAEDNSEEYVNEKKIQVDIGGITFVTFNSTLSKSSYLRSKLLTLESEYIFIDRDPNLFSYILTYLRTGNIFLKTDDSNFIESLQHEAVFYGLDELSYLIPRCYVQNPILELLSEMKTQRPPRTHTRRQNDVW